MPVKSLEKNPTTFTRRMFLIVEWSSFSRILHKFLFFFCQMVCPLTETRWIMYVCVSADHPYSQPKDWITKGAAQRDRPNAYERRLRLPPNGHEWSRSTAPNPDFLTWVKLRQHFLLSTFFSVIFKTLSVGPAGVELTTSCKITRCSTNWATGNTGKYC